MKCLETFELVEGMIKSWNGVFLGQLKLRNSIMFSKTQCFELGKEDEYAELRKISEKR